MTNDWQGPFFFLAMADPQLGRMQIDDGPDFDTTLWERAIAHANRLKPAFVVALGDLIQTPTSDAEAAEVKRIGGMLRDDIPLHWVVGNHDVGHPSEESLAWYRREFGSDWYTIETGGTRLVAIHSVIVDEPDNVPDDAATQFEWFKRTVATTTDAKHTIVFQHHPWYHTEPNEPKTSHSLPQPARAAHLELMASAGVSAVFAGHYHARNIVHHGDIEMVAAGTLSDTWSAVEPGFEIVKVYEDRLEHEYVTLDAVPRQVVL